MNKTFISGLIWIVKNISRGDLFRILHILKCTLLNWFLRLRGSAAMWIRWTKLTPPSGFPRSYVQKANDLGNPLGGVGLFHMIHIGAKHNTVWNCLNISIMLVWWKWKHEFIWSHLQHFTILWFLKSLKECVYLHMIKGNRHKSAYLSMYLIVPSVLIFCALRDKPEILCFHLLSFLSMSGA